MRIIEIILGLFFLIVIMNLWMNILSLNDEKISNYIKHLQQEAFNISLINWSNYFIYTLTGSPPYVVYVDGKLKYVWTWYIVFKDYNFLTSSTLESENLYNCRLDDFKLPGGILTLTWVFCRFYTNEVIFYNYKYY